MSSSTTWGRGEAAPRWASAVVSGASGAAAAGGAAAGAAPGLPGPRPAGLWADWRKVPRPGGRGPGRAAEGVPAAALDDLVAGRGRGLGRAVGQEPLRSRRHAAARLERRPREQRAHA